ncbi:hypothetical protein T4D_748 [Trichinella pseudospiralis]|uniref:Uncharacterized protein n=1 Tax=Trichinella pseudospiralis TaxID=6337 RepID=A0A0V1F745_TRIPS|nr:hypothetical protein T4D_748 [Trichinella pseudospiralis]
MEFSTCFYGERLKSTLMLNRGIRRLYMVALGADTKQVQVLRRYFIQILSTDYFIRGHRRDIQIQKTGTSTELSCQVQCFCNGVYFATTGVSTLPLACTLPPCSIKFLWFLNGRRGNFLSLSPRVTVPEYCILRVGGYTKLGTSRSLKMPRATPGAKVLKNSEILKNCPRHSLRRSLRAMPGGVASG